LLNYPDKGQTKVASLLSYGMVFLEGCLWQGHIYFKELEKDIESLEMEEGRDIGR